VAKPFDPAELRRRIENHLAARQHLQAQYREELTVDALGTVIEAEERAFVEELLSVIEENLQNPDFGVGDLAETMALSRRQLTRRVKEDMDETPGGLIRACRLRRAQRLLTGRSKTVAEVAYATGYRSPSHFSQSFREAVGETPTQYAEREDG